LTLENKKNVIKIKKTLKKRVYYKIIKNVRKRFYIYDLTKTSGSYLTSKYDKDLGCCQVFITLFIY